MVNQGIGVTAFFGVRQKPCRLGNHQKPVILINNPKVALCCGNRLFLHEGLYGFVREVKPEGIPCLQQLVSLRLAAVVFNALFPQHFIHKALGGLVHILQQKLVQPLIFLVFGNDNLFQGFLPPKKISYESMPDMR